MVHGKNRIPHWMDRRLTGPAGPDDDATISFGLPFEPEDCQYGKSWSSWLRRAAGFPTLSSAGGTSRTWRRETCER